ncbi:MAG: hypothetical protein LKI77_06870 [Bifidobacterium sp.]|jgi:hypothetical protein|nr:hypothetical protein [Bifidobacterium sp.]
MEPHEYQSGRFTGGEWVTPAEEERRIRILLHRRRDQILDRISDPSLTDRQREYWQGLHERINVDLRKAYGATLRDLREIAQHWK